jgi:hypothetical protein
MILGDSTLEKLIEIINEKPIYRSGSKLVNFFNKLGFKDSYGQGFPSRAEYTRSRLTIINGTPELDECLRTIFNPRIYAPNWSQAEETIRDFNQYLMFDGWEVVRNNTEITFKAISPNIDKIIKEDVPDNEEDFLKHDYSINLDNIPVDYSILNILKSRLCEIEKCLKYDIPLSSIFLSGSTLEGILLAVASKNPKEFNQANSAPRNKDGKVRQFYEWGLKDYIDVAFEVGVLKKDVKEFSHVLKSFRNYIHPYEQMSSQFYPDLNTAKICFQVLKAAIAQITEYFKLK